MTGEVQVVAGIDAVIAANKHVKVDARAWAETGRSTIDLTCSVELAENGQQ
jgi:hypothetical protein